MIKFKMLSQTSSSNSSNQDQTNIYIYLNKIQPSLNTERYGIRPSRRGYQKLNLSISISCIPFRMLNEIINYTQIAPHFFFHMPTSQPVSLWMLAALRLRRFSWNTTHSGGKIEPTNRESLSLFRSCIRARSRATTTLYPRLLEPNFVKGRVWVE